MFQTEKQEKIPEELSKVGTNNLPETKLKVMIIKILKELRKMHEHSKKFNRELEHIKKNQTDLRNTITKLKNTREGNSRRSDDI